MWNTELLPLKQRDELKNFSAMIFFLSFTIQTFYNSHSLIFLTYKNHIKCFLLKILFFLFKEKKIEHVFKKTLNTSKRDLSKMQICLLLNVSFGTAIPSLIFFGIKRPFSNVSSYNFYFKDFTWKCFQKRKW